MVSLPPLPLTLSVSVVPISRLKGPVEVRAKATRVAATRDETRGLAGPGRIAVDLESWAVARAAARAQVPWLALRVVVDPLDADLPAFARERHDGYVLPALRHALRGPRAMLELVRLGFRADTAIRALQQALLHLAPTLSRLGGQE